MIVYQPLWRTMKEKKISQYRLITYYGFSRGQLNRLKHNECVSTNTIGILCTILNCTVSDIMEFHMDNSEHAFPTPEMYELHLKGLFAPEDLPDEEADAEPTELEKPEALAELEERKRLETMAEWNEPESPQDQHTAEADTAE